VEQLAVVQVLLHPVLGTEQTLRAEAQNDKRGRWEGRVCRREKGCVSEWRLTVVMFLKKEKDKWGRRRTWRQEPLTKQSPTTPLPGMAVKL
jgi:hypothetical protein